MSKTNKKNFKGIRANSNVNASVHHKNVEKHQRLFMSYKYDSFTVIETIEVDENRNIDKRYNLAVTESPVIDTFGIVDEEVMNTQVKVKLEDKNGDLKTRDVRIDGKKYVKKNNIVLVKFTGKDKSIEYNYDKLRLEGLMIDGVKYYPVMGSNSLGKKSKVFFTCDDKNNNEDCYAKVDMLTGELLSVVLDSLGQIDYKKLAKIAVRVSLAATTPMIFAGKTNNVFYYDDSVLSAPENSGIDGIEDNFRDGYKIFSDSYTVDMYYNVTGKKISCAMARRFSLQDRIRGAAGKGHSRVYKPNWIYKNVKGMLQDNPSACHLWIDGKKIKDLNKLSEKELRTLCCKIDVLADADTFKWGSYLVNLDTLPELEVGIVNMSNVTDARMGAQIAIKMEGYKEDAVNCVEALTRRQIMDFVDNKGKLSFDKDNLRLSGSTFGNCMAVNSERAESDKLLNAYKIKQIDKMILKKVANLKFDMNSIFQRMCPEDSYLNNKVEVLGSRIVDFTMPDGNIVKVRATEIFSNAWLRKYREFEREVNSNEVMSDAEKKAVLLNSRLCIAVKSPSQGGREKEIFILVLPEEIRERNTTQEYIEFIEETPDNIVVWAQDNTLKNQLAGSDFDGDDQAEYFPEFSYDAAGKIVPGIYNGDKLVKCYASICIQKRVDHDNIGLAVLIKYGDNEPVGKQKESFDSEANDAKAQEVLNNLDYSSLL